jgi:hypothetical protein
MAIIATLPGVSVSVDSNGSVLPELCSPDIADLPRTATRYVQAQSGQQFTVRCNISNRRFFPSEAMRLRAYIDGQKLNARIVRKSDCEPEGMVEIIGGAIVGSFAIRPFVFSDLVVSMYEQKSFSVTVALTR